MAIELSKQLKENIIVKEITNNSFIILGEFVNTVYKIKINVKYYNTKIIDISPIYNEVIQQTIYKYTGSHIEIDYFKSDTCSGIIKITLKYDDCVFSGNSCIECNQKIVEYIKVKEEQEKVAKRLKYGDKTDLIITYKEFPKSYNNHVLIKKDYTTYDLVISDVDIEYIDLLDFISTYPANIIINGYFKIINYVNYQNIKNSSKWKNNLTTENILNITIQNCLNLKIINNIIHFKDNCNLKIINCPKLEFIENYNNFTEIYLNNWLVKVVNDEIKSLLKDQQEYAHIIQSLLKKINKLERKPIENE